jgi:predicted nucleotidyltransferase
VSRIRVELPQENIEAFCRRWRIAELAMFGSVLRDDFKPDSDVDILVTWAPGADWSLFDVVQMQDELSEMLARKVDLVSRRAVERSHNWIRRKAILGSAETVYVTG